MDKKLNIWLIKEGEALPVNDNARLMRTGLLARYLSENGHTVTWWSSGFIHGKKEYYSEQYQEIAINERETLVLLHSPIVYKRNVSLQRIIYHENLARQMKKKWKEKKAPDIILCSYPTIQFAKVAVEYGRKYNIPVILDVRDLWPDIFERVFPKPVQRLSKIVLLPLKLRTGNVFCKASGITGVVPDCIEWGLHYARRDRTEQDQCIFIGYSKEFLTEQQLEEHDIFWSKLGIISDTWNICFFGTLSGNSLDLSTVIQAVLRLAEKYPDIRLIVCGAGDGMEAYKREAQRSKHIVFPGWMGKDQMQSLMKLSKCGVYCYKNTLDFTNAFGNKIIQYMSEGLPVLSSLQGFSKEYITRYHMGTVYREGDVVDCATQIEMLYGNETERTEMAKQSLLRFETDFETEIVNQKFESYIYDVLASKKMTSKRNENS